MPSLSRSDLHDLSVFLLIVRYRSFRKSADHLDVTASALSHRMRLLEERLGVRLLNRTSRSVVPTAAGLALAEKVAAGLDLIGAGVDEVQGLKESAAGSLRLNVLQDAARLLLRPVLPVFAERYPNVEVEVAVEDHFVDVTAAGFDAGIRYEGSIPEDMIAVPLTPPLRWVVVAAPDYLRRRGRPTVPEDLMGHSCIRIRTGRGQIYRWEFEKGGETRELDVPGNVISGESALSVEAAVDGLGCFYCLEKLAAPHVAAGRLEVVLADWAAMGPGFAIYYSGRHQVPLGIRAMIEVIRAVAPLG